MKRLMRHLLFLAALLLAVSAAQAGIDPTTVQKLLADDGEARNRSCIGDRFGYSVSVSGATAVIGAWGDDREQGSVYIFISTAGGWHLQQKLTAADSTVADQFGWSVSASGDTVVIGASGNDSGKGAAYVFTRTDGVWSQQQKLTAADGAAGDWFGASVSISGDTVVIGANLSDGKKGAAYVFTRTDGVWSQQQKLTAADGATGDWFGKAVSISGDTAVIGASLSDGKKGVAYVFKRTGGVWSQQQKLTAADGAADDYFGESVSISGNTAVIGASGNDSGKGAACVFTRTGSVWSLQAKLTAAGDMFGHAVSVSGDTAVIGASLSNGKKGAAYVFTRTGGVWSQQAKLTAADGEADDWFGSAVSVSDVTAVVGAYLNDSYKGAAYVFTGSAKPSPEAAPRP